MINIIEAELRAGMQGGPVRSVAIVGAGTAVWLAAAALARALGQGRVDIAVIESADARAGAESTIPALHRLHNFLGLAEAEFMARTQATFKVGAEFRDWGALGESYVHGFAPIGARLAAVAFHHHWLRLRQAGRAEPLGAYSVACAMGAAGKFAHPSDDRSSPLGFFSYAYNCDGAAYAALLREYACARGVRRLTTNVAGVELDGESGAVAALRLADGTRFSAEFYIDCTPDAQVASRTPGWALQDWGAWLACDRVVTAAAPAEARLAPLTRVRAGAAGWRWRVGLRDRTACGAVYCSAELSDEAAAAELLADNPGADETALHYAPIRQGRPERFWTSNCLALWPDGIEPLEATRLHLAQTGVMRFLSMYPDRADIACGAEEYNRLTALEHERIRDFVILHYKATARDDTHFWRAMRAMDAPDALARRIELFARTGRLALRDDEHFDEASWLSVLIGQGVAPRAYDPLADAVALEEAEAALAQAARAVRAAVDSLPMHDAYLARGAGAQAAWS